MKMTRKVVLSCLAALLIVGCAGDDDDDDHDNPPPELEELVIDQDNAVEVASAVLRPITLLIEIGSLDELLPDGLDAATLAAANVGDVISALSFEQTIDCDSGSATLSVNIDDGDLEYLRVGDTLGLTFNNCAILDSALLNGRFGLEVIALPDGEIPLDPDFEFEAPYEIGVRLSYTDLAVELSGEMAQLNGSMDLHESTDDDVVFDTEISGDELVVTLDGERELLRNFLIDATVDAGDGSYAFSVSCLETEGDTCAAELQSDSLEGTVEFFSVSPFRGVGANAPESGLLEIIGAIAPGGVGRSQLSVDPIDSNCVELRVDEDGDGVFDWSDSFLWESLLEGSEETCD